MSKFIQKMFAEVPRTYKLLNHLLTFGQDIVWRRRGARIAAASGGTLWLDACSGTGDMATCLSQMAKNGTNIVAVDFSLPMMSKAEKNLNVKLVAFTLADVSRLPFQDNCFDGIIISFATRNINLTKDNLITCLHEFYRVLKPGGQYVNLDTSQPKFTPIRWLFHLYIKLAVRPIGRLISGSDAAYTYLSHSMRRFYSPDKLAEIIRRAGFCEVCFKRLFFGAAAIHTAMK